MNMTPMMTGSEMTMNGSGTGDGYMMMDGHRMPADDSVAMMMMQMVFYAGVDTTVLVSSWKTKNVGQLLGTCICWFIIAMLHHGTKRLRRSIARRFETRMSVGGFSKLQDRESTGAGSIAHSPESTIVVEAAGWRCKLLHHLLQSLIQLVQTTTSFILMLVFMTYNVWLALAIVLGDMVGYLVFSYDTVVIASGCG